MQIEDVKVGQRVCPHDDPSDVGNVDRIDYDDNAVWVHFPVPGGFIDELEFDPADLGPA